MTAYRPQVAPSELKSGPHDDLSAVARHLGVPHRGAASLEFDDQGGRTRVELSFNSGTVDGFDVTAFSHPFPEVTLRSETDVDRRGKEKGINVEIQLGDAEFDRRVYIETDAYDAAVRALLAAPWVRAAAATLLFQCFVSTIDFGPRGVSVHVSTGLGEAIRTERVLEVLGPLHVLRAAPYVPLADRVRRRTEKSIGLFAVTALLSMLLFFLVAPLCWADSWLLPLYGLGAGLAAFVPLWGLLRVGVRGHSRAYRHYVWAFGLSLGSCVFAGPALALFLNVVLDDGRVRQEEGKVVTVKKDDDDGGAIILGDFGKNGTGSGHYSVSPSEVCVGDRLVRRRHAGFFGFSYAGSTQWTSTVPRPCK